MKLEILLEELLPTYAVDRLVTSCTYLFHAAESFLRSQLVLQLIKKFPAFYGTTLKFITVLTSARHPSLS